MFLICKAGSVKMQVNLERIIESEFIQAECSSWSSCSNVGVLPYCSFSDGRLTNAIKMLLVDYVLLHSAGRFVGCFMDSICCSVIVWYLLFHMLLIRSGKDPTFRRSGRRISLQRHRTSWFWRAQTCHFTLAVTTEARHGPHQGFALGVYIWNACMLVVVHRLRWRCCATGITISYVHLGDCKV